MIELLPTKLIDKLESTVYQNCREYRKKNNYTKCVSILLFKKINDGTTDGDYSPTGSSYWKKVFNTNMYMNIITPLIKNNIIEVECLRGGRKVVNKWYRINPTLLNTDFRPMPVFYAKNRPRTSSTEKKEEIDDINVSLNKSRVTDWINNVDLLYYENYLQDVTLDTLKGKIKVKESYASKAYMTKYYSKDKVQEVLDDHDNLDFFYYKKNYYLCNKLKFKQNKINELNFKYHYYKSLVGSPIDISRNATNLRLHSYLSNYPSNLLPFIEINNKPIIQIDLQCSQVVLLANIIKAYLAKGDGVLSVFRHKKTLDALSVFIDVLKQEIPLDRGFSMDVPSDDLFTFLGDVLSKDFYSVLQDKLNLPNRKHSKNLTFGILFSNDLKKKGVQNTLGEIYPSLISLLSKYQQTCDTHLAVMLQMVEAEIFIDKIFYTLRERGIKCFTRHDSVLCTNEDSGVVYRHMNKVFQDIGFKYLFKVDDFSTQNIDLNDVDNDDFWAWIDTLRLEDDIENGRYWLYS